MRNATSLMLIAAGMLPATIAQAQTEPDIRNIRPVVILLVDTSGSTERTSDGDLPMCSGSSSGTNERNRWTTMLEALTGTWSDSEFYCTSVPRTSASFSSEPDYNYFLPYHEPPIGLAQQNDGALDVYMDRVKFGLMTMDSVYTFTDSHPLLVPQTIFTARASDNVGALGGYSYGGARPLTYPGCETTFMVDTGARNANAARGALISVGTETDDHRMVNLLIQNQLLAVRPFGGTTTAALLHDAREYLSSHSDITSDPFATCRDRFVVLVTDGPPDEDFRDARFNCDAADGCPYDLASTIAGDMCRYGGASTGCTGAVDGVFVVAYDVADSGATAELDAIADLGGTGAALAATTREELMRRISEALSRTAPGITTRTRPAFIAGASSFTSGGVANSLEFNAGFQIGTPWSGLLERTRYVCDESLQPRPEPASQRVRFDEVLSRRTTQRRLLTVVTSDPDEMTTNLIGAEADSVPLGATVPPDSVRSLSLSEFNSTNLTPAHFGIAGSSSDAGARRDRIVDWVHGRTSDRQNARLGDIYHSSPVAVGPPRLDIADESYNLFRRRPEVVNRPTIVYVGSNDGVLHAFVAEDWTNPTTGESYPAGHELWGFVPPVLVPKLESAAASHQMMVDATPLVRDIFYRRSATDQPSGNIYHTVLLMGMRAGAPGYFALDVTDPLNPVFLWQYVGEQQRGGSATPLGLSYGRPAIGQVIVTIAGATQERAIALLPGGAGEVDEQQARENGPVGCPGQGVGQPPPTQGTGNARSRQRCWGNTGRILTWVDVVTGEIIQGFDHRTFNAPLTGGVSLYPGDVGSIAERAFLTDADGVMWAIDFSARRPTDWSARPFHDLFWDDDALAGQPVYDPPVVTVDNTGQIVVLAGSGDIDRLDGSADNRVVSLTEVRTISGTTPSYATALNWQINLRPGEQMTGAIELFDSTAYFSTFESGTSPSNACTIGRSRIWGVHYHDAGSTVSTGYTDTLGGRFPLSRFESSPGSGTFDRHFRGPFEDQLVLGVGITQRPTCVDGADVFDPYLDRRFQVRNSGGGTFELSAQVSGARNPDGGRIATMSVQLPTPAAYTTLSGFAGRVDY